MNTVVKKYNLILQFIIIIMPLIWIFDLYNKSKINLAVNIFVLLFIIFTVFLAVILNISKKMYYRYIIMLIYMIITVIVFFITSNEMNNNQIVSLSTMLIFPLGLLTIDEIRISDRIFGLLSIIISIISFLNLGNSYVIKELSYLLIPISFITLYKEDNLFIKIIYIMSNILLLSLFTHKTYILIFAFLIELAFSLAEKKQITNKSNYIYMIIFLIGVITISLECIDPIAPVTFLMAICANKGYIKDKKCLFFTSNDLSIGGIETSLVNLLNNINPKKYDVTLYLESKKGTLLNKVDKNIYIKKYKVYNLKLKILSKIINFTKRICFSIFNYNIYDFSCCYATYSYAGNKLAKIASTNSSIWVHSNYKYVYKNINKTKEFFESRNMDNFRRIIFVSNEARNDYLEMYPSHKNKTLVINNLVNISLILDKSKESLGFNKPKNKKLLVFVGRLEEDSKRITRLLEIAKEINNVALWIIGDGKDKKMYEKFIKDNKLDKKVTMFGSINEPYNYMDKADYIILTSEYEGFPVVYLEALILKKEIITTIPVSDERLDFKTRTHIISKDNYIEDVKLILKKAKKKNEEINYKEIQYQRKRKIEKLFEGVI